MLKGVVENLCQALRINPEHLSFDELEHPALWLHPGQCCQLAIKKRNQKDKEEFVETIGILGELHPAITSKLKLRGPSYVFELSIDKLHTVCDDVEYQP